VGDAISPLVAGESPSALSGLTRALAASGAQVTVVTLAAPDSMASIPGLARRLRTFQVLSGSDAQEVAFYEGRAHLSQANLVVVGAKPVNRGQTAGILADAVKVLMADALLKVDVAVAWGEGAAWALSFAQAGSRVFVLPSGRTAEELSESELAVLGANGAFAQTMGARSLAAVGAAYANVIVVPSPFASELLEKDRALVSRASDEACVPIRFGADDPPNDPSSDSVQTASFSAKSIAGKVDCRRALTKRYSLTVGPRTLVLGVAPLRSGKGGEEVFRALAMLAALDVVVVVPADGDSDLTERVRRLSVQSPGRLVVMEPGDGQHRVLRGAADAFLCADPDDRTGRAAALAQRYGALPIVLDSGASHDFLVDYDSASHTGTAILIGGLEPWQIEGAVRRATALKNGVDVFPEICQRLMETAPVWSRTASLFDEIAAQYTT